MLSFQTERANLETHFPTAAPAADSYPRCGCAASHRLLQRVRRLQPTHRRGGVERPYCHAGAWRRGHRPRAGEQPVGYATWEAEGSGDPSGLGPWAKDKLTVEPNPIRNTTTEFSTDTAEQVAALDPTKIIAVNSGFDSDKQALLQQIAPATFHSDQHEDWQVPWDEQIKEIAAALGKEAEGDKLIAESEQAFADFRRAHPELQGKTAVIGMPYDGKLGVYTAGDGRGSFIEKLGFTIPDKFNGDGSSFFIDWSPENYSDFNDVDYVFILDYYGAIDALKKMPRLRTST
ncbi:ABC transporter substrate-binding protein [Corynebacterium aquatimens]|uniref:ABC transporter substrate-binding protein n=1 Tax=Corynebacterium aquatimens TaxID=1190508 RepID=UPI003313DC9B